VQSSALSGIALEAICVVVVVKAAECLVELLVLGVLGRQGVNHLLLLEQAVLSNVDYFERPLVQRSLIAQVVCQGCVYMCLESVYIGFELRFHLLALVFSCLLDTFLELWGLRSAGNLDSMRPLKLHEQVDVVLKQDLRSPRTVRERG